MLYSDKQKERGTLASVERPQGQDKTRQTVYGYSNIEARLCNHCCCGKAIGITYSEFVYVALVSQHEERMRLIILSSVACPALPNFSTYLTNGAI